MAAFSNTEIINKNRTIMKALNRFIWAVLIFITIGASMASAQENKIAVLYPGYTEKMMRDNPLWVKDQITKWELFLIENRHNYAVIDDKMLEKGLSSEFGVLLMPVAKALSNAELNSIKNFLNNGKSVFANWSFAAYDEKGTWRGWNEFEDMFGLTYNTEIPRSDVSRVHSIAGDNHFSAGIPAGFRLQATTYDSPVAARVSSLNSKALGYWYSDNLPFEGLDESELITSLAYGSASNGKFFWMGFDILSVVGTKTHQTVLTALINNAFSWLQNKPVAWVQTWPRGMQAAAIISCDVEFQFENINSALDIFQEKNIEGQFYILTDVIDEPSLMRILKFGDVGLHGDDHDPFQWQSFEVQKKRLSSSLNIVKSMTRAEVLGFRPPETVYDDNTISILKSLGIKYLNADFVEDRAVPQFHKGSKDLLIIPKTGYDDYDLFIRMKLNNYRLEAERYLKDYHRVYSEGGLYVLNYHTQLQCLENHVEALRIVIDEIKGDKTWITTAAKVRDWWLTKDDLRVDLKSESKNRYTINVTNRSSYTGEDLVICLSNGDIISSVMRISDSGRNLDYSFDSEKNQLKIYLTSIAPNQTKRISIELNDYQ